MDNKLKDKLTHALQHSKDFLYGLPVFYDDYKGGRQERIYNWLREEGKKKWGENFDFKSRPYDEVTSQLLENPGIEKLVEDIIIPRVRELYTPALIDELRIHWSNGSKPNEVFLKRYDLTKGHAYPFLIVNEYGYNERVASWNTEWAIVWFEFIEEWIKEKGALNK